MSLLFSSMPAVPSFPDDAGRRHDHPRETSPVAKTSAPEIEEIARQFYLVSLRRADGRWKIRLLTRSLTLEAFVCAPDSPAARRATDILVASRCAELEGARAPSTARLQQLVGQLEKEFSSKLATTDIDEIPALETSIVGRFTELMNSTGWMDDFVAAWRTHVVDRSPCYTREKRKLLASRRETARRKGIECGDWLTYLGFCTADSDDLGRHVTFNREASPPPVVVRVIEALAEAGLPDCLGRIVLDDDPELAGMIRALRLRQSRHVRTDVINRRARELWRRRGVNRWYEIVRKEGKVPERLRLEILQCAGGYLPPVVETADEPPPPSSRPVR